MALIMDSAQVGHQHVVDEDPHIVVAGELKGGRRLLGGVGIAFMPVHKPGGQGHAKVVVQGIVSSRMILAGIIIEGEEHSRLPIILYGRAIIKGKALRTFVVIRIVFRAVVIVIAVCVVLLEQTAHIAAGLPIGCIGIRVKQVSQRFTGRDF